MAKASTIMLIIAIACWAVAATGVGFMGLGQMKMMEYETIRQENIESKVAWLNTNTTRFFNDETFKIEDRVQMLKDFHAFSLNDSATFESYSDSLNKISLHYYADAVNYFSIGIIVAAFAALAGCVIYSIRL